MQIFHFMHFRMILLGINKQVSWQYFLENIVMRRQVISNIVISI